MKALKQPSIEKFTHSDTSFRSDYERRLVQCLKTLVMKFSYEGYVFHLEKGEGYVPDFLIENRVFVEVKGKWTVDGKRKFLAVTQEFPEIPFYVFDRRMLGTIYQRRR